MAAPASGKRKWRANPTWTELYTPLLERGRRGARLRIALPVGTLSGDGCGMQRCLDCRRHGGPLNRTKAFLEARDFLIANGQDYDRARAGFMPV